MFCKYCGSSLPAGASFCITCGKKIITGPVGNEKQDLNDTPRFDFEASSTTYDFPAAGTPAQPTPTDEARDAHGGKILCFAILALAFSLSFYLAIVGTVFFILAKVQLGKYLAKYGETEGRASVGKALSIAALPVNIVMISCTMLIILAILLA